MMTIQMLMYIDNNSCSHNNNQDISRYIDIYLIIAMKTSGIYRDMVYIQRRITHHFCRLNGD